MGIRTGLAALVMLAVAVGPVFAQGVSGGVKGGAGFATVSPDDNAISPPETRTTVVIGGFVDVSAGGPLSVMIEGLFSQKGAKYADHGLEATAQVAYVEVPVLLKGAFARMRRVQPFVYAGVAPAFNTSATLQVAFGGQAFEEDFSDEIKPMDVGFIFGGGLRFGVLAIESRYNLGLVNVVEPEGESHAKNRQAAILASVFFGGR